MNYPTSSTVPLVKSRLVVLFREGLDDAHRTGGQLPVDYAWPGPDTSDEHVFLGRHPELDDIRVPVDHDIPTLKAGRHQRQETYQVPLTIWTFRPELRVDLAEECERRGFEILALIENVLAADAQLGIGPQVQSCQLDNFTSTLFPFKAGWACELLGGLEVRARLL